MIDPPAPSGLRCSCRGTPTTSRPAPSAPTSSTPACLQGSSQGQKATQLKVPNLGHFGIGRRVIKHNFLNFWKLFWPYFTVVISKF